MVNGSSSKAAARRSPAAGIVAKVLRSLIATAVLGGCTAKSASDEQSATNVDAADGRDALPADGRAPDAMQPNDSATPSPDRHDVLDADGPPDGPADTGAPDVTADAGGMLPTRSTGCTSTSPLGEGAATLPDGRPFVIHLPDAHTNNKPWPVVFANHPNGGSIGSFADQTTRSAMRTWAILVLTEAKTRDWRQSFVDDLAYFDALVALLKARLCVDVGRVYSFGFSGGGSFSSLLACKRDYLRAFGSGGGIPGYDGYTEADCRPTAAWVEQGGRTGMLELWRAKNGCSADGMPGKHGNCKVLTCTNAPMVYCGPNPEHVWPSFGSEAVADFFSQQ
jgi:hypothetical protein